MNPAIRTLTATVCAFGIGSAAAAAQGADALSLRDAEQRALKDHPRIRAAEYSALAADETVRAARSVYFPTVTANLTGAQAQSGTRIAAGGLNNPTILDRFATGFSVGQLITDFGRTNAIVQSADFRADSERQTAESRRADVLRRVDRAYFNVLRAQAVERVAQATVDARQAVADQVTALAASGLKSGLDVSFARVNLSEAQLLLVQAHSDVEAAFARLSAAMGSAQPAVYVLKEEPLPPEPPSDAAELVAAALRERPDLASERSASHAAEKFALAERALWLPSVSLIGAAGATPYRELGLNSRYAAVGVNVSVPLASGGLLSARRAEAGLRASAEEQRLRDLENTVARDVRTAWLDAQAAYRRLQLADELRAHAADAADLAQARYDIGLGSIVELSQAQLNKTRADIERASAEYDCQIRMADLKYQTGALK
jgi:outer membrane protein